MCGRDGEWRIVRELLRRAQRGMGGVLLVEGEWGMGKSALLREADRLAAAQGFSLAFGSADPLGQMMPFFALLTALNEPFDEVTAEDRPACAGMVDQSATGPPGRAGRGGAGPGVPR